MSWSDSGAGRRGYHHGNLREALIDATLALITEKGPTGFTMAEAARLVSVSPAAPYRHFRDAEALLAEVARRGFDLLGAGLDDAWRDGRPDLTTAFEAMGRAYLTFARQQPAYYAAMFEMRIAADAYPELAAASDRSFGVLRAAVDQLIAPLPAPRRPPALMVALHIWSLSHGVAALFCRPDRRRRPLPMSAEDLLESGVLLYLQSLGLAGGIPGKPR